MPTIWRLFNSCSDATRVALLLQMAGVPVAETSIIANNSENWFKSSRTAGLAAPVMRKSRSGVATNEAWSQEAAVSDAIRATAAGSLIIRLSLPGLGVVIGTGWLAAMLAGARIGVGEPLGVLTRSGASDEEAQLLAEGVRRGGTLVVVRVQPEHELEPHIETLMDFWAVNLRERSDIYYKSGWRSFDLNAEPYTADQVRCERILHAIRRDDALPSAPLKGD